MSPVYILERAICSPVMIAIFRRIQARGRYDLRRSRITHVSKMRQWQYPRRNYDICHTIHCRTLIYHTRMFYDCDMVERNVNARV